MTTTDTYQRVPLAPEDLVRVRRLTEEVKSRLFEVGLITGRTVGHNIPPGTVIKYEPRESSTDQTGGSIEVVIIKLPDGTFCCTQDPPGECVCPC